jgi:hypothetical protein
VATESALSVLAAAAEESGFGWGKVLESALGIVAAVLLAFVMSKFPRGRLENRLLELQVQEKEREEEAARVVAEGDPERVVRVVSRPILEGRIAQDLLLRSVLLYLLIQAWGIVANLLGSALASAQLALDRALAGDFSTLSVVGYLLVAWRHRSRASCARCCSSPSGGRCCSTWRSC